MFKMPVLVVIESLKAAKDEKSNNYADFLFTGGSISIPIDRAAFDQLKPLEGSEVTALFQMKPFQVVRFGGRLRFLSRQSFLSSSKDKRGRGLVWSKKKAPCGRRAPIRKAQTK